MNNRNKICRRTALAAALSMSFAGAVMAQSTSGNIFGQATPGDTITVSSAATGVTRDAAVDSSGRYRVTNLPLGTYTVTLKKDGAVVGTRENVALAPNAGTPVNFAAESTQLSAVTVMANALPAIDVSSVNSSTVITAADLQRLPVTRSAESIALLAPGTAAGQQLLRQRRCIRWFQRSPRTPTTSMATTPASRTRTSAASSCPTARSTSRKPSPAATAPSTVAPMAA